jgi:hypothetical protein
LETDGTLLRAIADPEAAFVPGDDVCATVDFRRDVHLFEKNMGVRLAAVGKEV